MRFGRARQTRPPPKGQARPPRAASLLFLLLTHDARKLVEFRTGHVDEFPDPAPVDARERVLAICA
jgi:hypothetical protein